MERRNFSTDWKNSSEWRKWFLINNRLFFFIGFFFILLYGLKRKILPALLISLCFFIGGFGYLLVKAKTEPYILASAFSFICFTIFLCTKQDILRNTKAFRIAALAGLFFFIAWGGIRLYKTSVVNRSDTARFRQQYAELSAHPEKLFIHIKGFAIQKFYAFDSPASFPLSNFLQAERFTAHNYASTLSRFGIHNVKEIFSSPDVLFWGHPPDGLKTYFEKVAGKPLLRSDPLPEFRHGIVWRVIQDSNQSHNKYHR
jgi:hypothetical protein